MYDRFVPDLPQIPNALVHLFLKAPWEALQMGNILILYLDLFRLKVLRLHFRPWGLG